jgi:hypothetical protein
MLTMHHIVPGIKVLGVKAKATKIRIRIVKSGGRSSADYEVSLSDTLLYRSEYLDNNKSCFT